jgi:Ca-activated chloride channel family protein
MSFGEPLVLLALIALPLLALLYLRQQGRRRAAAAAFARPAVQPSVAPRRPRWRRHVPMFVFALALGALIVAAARPQRTVAVPVERASIMLLTDVSGSMEATDVRPNRLAAVKRAAHRFVDRVPDQVNVGLIAFNQTPRVLTSPTRDRAAIHTSIERMESSGGTASGEAIATATRILASTPGELGRRPPAAMVLISDGESTSGRDEIAAAQEAKDKKIPIYTVALGTESGTIEVERDDGTTETRPVPPDPEALAEIARASGGKTFTADTTDGLSAVYERLGSQLGHRDEKRQVTSAVAGGGLALLLAGAAMSLGWLGRPI